MSLSDSKARLTSAHRDLLIAWNRVSGSWHDDASRAFHERTIEPLDKQIRAGINAIDGMADTLRRVRNECGEGR